LPSILVLMMIEVEDFTEPVNAVGKRATYANEKYGPHKRNTFDIWLADSEKPTPLVMYIHGGGFVGGDKSRYYDSQDWIRFLEKGVSVATINYRFMNEPPYGILASMTDSKRCLQYIKQVDLTLILAVALFFYSLLLPLIAVPHL